MSVVDVQVGAAGSVTVVALVGELDSVSAPSVQQRLMAVVTGHDRVLVDMAGVRYMSSAGLRTMLLLYRHAQAAGTAVGLVGLSDELRSMMAATGFLDSFTVDATIAEGVRGLEIAARSDLSQRSAS